MPGPSGIDERNKTGGPPGNVVVRLDRRPSRLVLLVPLVVLALFGLGSVLRVLPGLQSPFGTETRDRSQPALLKSIQDLSRYTAASGNFQVVVDLEQDAKFLPDAVRGQRTLFVGAGTVDAYVDFSKLGGGALTVSADRTAVKVRLPKGQLETAALDTKRSYVFAQQRGLLDRVAGFFSSNPDSQRQVYELAQEKIQRAAQDSGLTARAEQNTRTMLEGMLRSLGFRDVTVEFGPVVPQG
jgi:Protein of unknown function (DUF4230)